MIDNKKHWTSMSDAFLFLVIFISIAGSHYKLTAGIPTKQGKLAMPRSAKRTENTKDYP